jgi:diguanylate cyclase (GGDEF)-like protein
MVTEEARKILDFHTRLAIKSANSSDLHKLLESVISETVSFLDASSGSIMVYDSEEKCLKLYVSSQHPRLKRKPKGPVAKVAATEGIAGKVFASGKPIIVEDLAKADEKIKLRNRENNGSFLSVPLKISNRIIGVMNFNREGRTDGFTRSDLEKLASVDTTIAGLIEKENLLETINENRREISGLYTLSCVLADSSDFFTSLNLFLTKLSELLGLERSAVIKLTRSKEQGYPEKNQKSPEFEILASHRLKESQLKEMFDSVSSRLRTQLMDSWPVSSFENEQIQPPLSLTFEENKTPRELFCIPLLVENHPSHLLLVSRHYHSDDHDKAIKHYRFLYLISQNLSMALEREKMFQRIREDHVMLLENATRNRIFLDISKDLASTLDPYVILQKAFNQFSKVISYTSIAILLFDDLDETYRLIVQPSESISPRYQNALAKHIFGVFREYPSEPALTEENFFKPAFFKPQKSIKKPYGKFKQTLHLPIVIGDRVAGLIHLSRATDDPFTNHELDVTSQFTGIFITSIKNALIHKRTEKLAFTDPLTGLFNHRYFQETLAHEFIRAKRYDKPLSLMVIDIDFFKKFNDTYGHLVGDKVLRHVAEIFGHSIREQIDTVARYGGEEFAVILPETSLKGAKHFAERIRSKVEESKIIEDDQELSVTLSIGVACTRVTECEKTSNLIEAADIALYRAKDNGRNQVRTFEESTIYNASKKKETNQFDRTDI